MTSSEAVRWALVGTTSWADHTFARAITAGGGLLVGAVGSTEERSKAFAQRHGALRSFRGMAELCGSDEVDVVWVASPSHRHRQDALAALDAGKHVLVEKPLAVQVRDAEAMVHAASTSDRITAIGFQHRFNPAHRYLAQLVRSGSLGPLTFLRLHMFLRSPDLPSTWRQSPETSGGWAINDIGSHLLDLLNFFYDGFSVVGAVLTANRFPLPVDDLCILLLQSGTVASVVEVSTATGDAVSRIEVFGQDDRVVVDNSWSGGGEVVVGSDARYFDPVNTYAEQVRAVNEAASTGTYLGAGWEEGLRAVRQVVDATRLARLAALSTASPSENTPDDGSQVQGAARAGT